MLSRFSSLSLRVLSPHINCLSLSTRSFCGLCRTVIHTVSKQHQKSSFITSVASASSVNHYNQPTSTTNMSQTDSPIARLRSTLKQHGLSCYIVPSADSHQSEYVAECDKRRAYISGFTGSAGTALILTEPTEGTNIVGRLWTDGRYFLQASQQLDSSCWELMKQGQPETLKLEDWLSKYLPTGSKVGVDPQLMSISQYKALLQAFEGTTLTVVPVQGGNLVDTIWNNRPAQPSAPLRILSDSMTGETTSSKVAKIRKQLTEKKAWGVVISALDEVAWLFNLRGADVEFNPVFFSYAIVTNDFVRLYIEQSKITDAVRAHLGDAVEIKPYNSLLTDLQEFAKTITGTKQFWLDVNKCNVAIYQQLDKDQVLEQDSPITMLKSVKNANEIEGMRQAHIRDGVALCQFLHWLENELTTNQQHGLTEVTAADKLESFRAQQQNFVGLSFDTISGMGSNGAIIHYKPETETCAKLNTDQMYLLDSGAQYLDGTTDVTRTMHFGQPTLFEQECFTRVLKGHLALANVVFPPGTTGK